MKTAKCLYRAATLSGQQNGAARLRFVLALLVGVVILLAGIQKQDIWVKGFCIHFFRVVLGILQYFNSLCL